jgi:hypothetical protein
VLVGGLLDRRRHHPRGPDPVRAHDHELLHALLVKVGGAQGLGVARAQLEDVRNLDRGLDLDRAARRARVAGLDGANVGPGGLEIAAWLHAAQVPVGLVRARHQPVQAAQGLVGHHLDSRVDGPDEARLGAEQLL